MKCVGGRKRKIPTIINHARKEGAFSLEEEKEEEEERLITETKGKGCGRSNKKWSPRLFFAGRKNSNFNLACAPVASSLSESSGAGREKTMHHHGRRQFFSHFFGSAQLQKERRRGRLHQFLPFFMLWLS